MDENNWLGVQAGSGTLSAFSAFMGVIAQKQALRTQADIAQINAEASERQAQQRLAVGQREEQRSMLATANLKGRQRTGYAARNIDLGEGSAAQVLASTDVMGKIDANTIAANAVRDAWGYRTQATNYSNQAAQSRGAAGAMSPALAVGTSLLSSAATVSERWYALNKAGAFTGNGSTAPAPASMPSDPPTNYWGP
jgi:hypothetical protein